MGFFPYMGEILWVFLTFMEVFPIPPLSRPACAKPLRRRQGEVRRGMGYIWRCSIKQFIFKLVVQLIYYFLFSPLSRIPPFHYSIISLFSSTLPFFFRVYTVLTISKY